MLTRATHDMDHEDQGMLVVEDKALLRLAGRGRRHASKLYRYGVRSPSPPFRPCLDLLPYQWTQVLQFFTSHDPDSPSVRCWVKGFIILAAMTTRKAFNSQKQVTGIISNALYAKL